MIDVLVVGAGPAGLSAALELRSHGLAVTLVDDQPAPGGRIFAAIESRKPYGKEDADGLSLVEQFRRCGADYLSGAEIWQIESGPRVFLTKADRVTILEPRYILIATGAQERPMPFPGWELPGVMTVGSAQILLKTARQVPTEPIWLAGTGPLFLLYIQQLQAAGGTVAGVLDTTPPGGLVNAARLLPGALAYGWRDLVRGARWLAGPRRYKVVRNVVGIHAIGSDRLQEVRYSTRAGETGAIATNLLLIHDGVIPAIHATMAAGCAHRWSDQQECFQPILDDDGQSTNPIVFVAGDGASIAGARAAAISGRLAAIGIARAAGAAQHSACAKIASELRAKLISARRFRRLIDRLYPPSNIAIPDETLVCRCEEVSAAKVREVLAGRKHAGPDGVKIATRAGMGPCQGRQCGLTLTRLVAEVHKTTPEKVGFLRVRPPIKPLTLDELATLEKA